MTSAMLLALASLESWAPSDTPADADNKIGVWKTYADYVSGNLTDLGSTVENPNYWKDSGIFFDKEKVMPATTQYWGARVPQTNLKPGSFVRHEIPEPNTSVPKRFSDGKDYRIMINPMPIGLYTRGGHAVLKYDAKGDVIDLKVVDNKDVFFYVGKADGKVISTHERDAARSMLEDDPEILKAFDKDETFKGHAMTSTKQTIVFLKYMIRYNRKHTPGYVAEVKEYTVKDNH